MSSLVLKVQGLGRPLGVFFRVPFTSELGLDDHPFFQTEGRPSLALFVSLPLG